MKIFDAAYVGLVDRFDGFVASICIGAMGYIVQPLAVAWYAHGEQSLAWYLTNLCVGWVFLLLALSTDTQNYSAFNLWKDASGVKMHRFYDIAAMPTVGLGLAVYTFEQSIGKGDGETTLDWHELFAFYNVVFFAGAVVYMAVVNERYVDQLRQRNDEHYSPAWMKATATVGMGRNLLMVAVFEVFAYRHAPGSFAVLGVIVVLVLAITKSLVAATWLCRWTFSPKGGSLIHWVPTLFLLCAYLTTGVWMSASLDPGINDQLRVMFIAAPSLALAYVVQVNIKEDEAKEPIYVHIRELENAATAVKPPKGKPTREKLLRENAGLVSKTLKQRKESEKGKEWVK